MTARPNGTATGISVATVRRRTDTRAVPRLPAVPTRATCLAVVVGTLAVPTAAASVDLRLASPGFTSSSYAGIASSGAAIFLTSGEPTPLDATQGLDLYASRVEGIELLASVPSASPTSADLRVRGASADGRVVAYLRHVPDDGPDLIYTPYLRTPDLDRPLVPGGTATSPAAHVVAISPDGRRRLFSTEAPLLGADTDTSSDVYLDDDDTGLHLLTPGVVGPLGVFAPCGHSRDLRRIAFGTADPLVPEDVNGVEDVYETSVAGTVVRRTALPPGSLPGAECLAASADLETVVFTTGGRLVAEDTDTAVDLYAHGAGGTVRVARDPERLEVLSVSDDGAAVMFRTSSALVAGDTNDFGDVYQWRAGVLRLFPSTIVSADHRTAALVTDERLLPADSDGGPDVYLVRDDVPVELVTPGATGSTSYGLLAISADGRRVVFSTLERVTADDRDAAQDIYLGGEGVRLVSGTGAGPVAFKGASQDLTTVVFETADALTPDDTDAEFDHYRATFTPPPVPAPAVPPATGPAPSTRLPAVVATPRPPAPAVTPRPMVTSARRVTLRALARRGLRLAVTTTGVTRIEARLRVTSAVKRRLRLRSAYLGTVRGAARSGRRVLVLRVPSATRARLARMRGTTRATLEVRAVGAPPLRAVVTRRAVLVARR